MLAQEGGVRGNCGRERSGLLDLANPMPSTIMIFKITVPIKTGLEAGRSCALAELRRHYYAHRYVEIRDP